MASEENMTPEQYYAQHQKAFRTAFDFLVQHFPPGIDLDWWKKTTDEIGIAYDLQKDELTYQLLRAVFEYLDYEWKRRNPNGIDNQESE